MQYFGIITLSDGRMTQTYTGHVNWPSGSVRSKAFEMLRDRACDALGMQRHDVHVVFFSLEPSIL